jgi:hypothetical protein
MFGGNLAKYRASLITGNDATRDCADFPIASQTPKEGNGVVIPTRPWRRTIIELMKLKVESYSGRKADERPIRFWLEGRQYFIKAVLDQWYDPESIYYRVRADDGNLCILRQRTPTPNGAWDLVSFRQTREEW